MATSHSIDKIQTQMDPRDSYPALVPTGIVLCTPISPVKVKDQSRSGSWDRLKVPLCSYMRLSLVTNLWNLLPILFVC